LSSALAQTQRAARHARRHAADFSEIAYIIRISRQYSNRMRLTVAHLREAAIIGRTYLEPCPARSSMNAVSPNGDMDRKGVAGSPAEQKIAGAAARCRQPP
jgi:hypothetical protein